MKVTAKKLFLIFTITVICSVLPFSAVAGEKVTDKRGITTVVEKPFKRIVSLYGAHTENIVMLGAESSIVGVSRSDGSSVSINSGATVFSAQDGPEKFYAVKPDLVLVRPMLERAYPVLIKRLEKQGITVMSFQPGNVNEMYDYWLALGIITGKKDNAVSMVREFKKSVDEIKSKTTGVKQKKRVYFEAMHRQMKTFSKDSMAIFCLETAGGINIADDAVSSRGSNIGNYGKEKILSKAQFIDVFLFQKGRMNSVTIDDVLNEPGFQIIKAVKEGKVFSVDENLVSRPTPELIEGVKTIGKVLYPELFM